MEPYVKTAYVNDSAPAINAENLNKSEQGIFDVTNFSNFVESQTEKAIDLVSGVEVVNFTKYYAIVTSGTTVDISNPVASPSGYSYGIADCQEGDEFVITGNGGSDYRLYCFIDSQGNVLLKAGAGGSLVNAIRTAPENAAKAIFNFTPAGGSVIKGQTTDARISKNNTSIIESVRNRKGSPLIKNIFTREAQVWFDKAISTNGTKVGSTGNCVVQIPVTELNVPYQAWVINNAGTSYTKLQTRWNLFKADGTFIRNLANNVTSAITFTDLDGAYLELYMPTAKYNNTDYPPMVIVNESKSSYALSEYVDPRVVLKAEHSISSDTSEFSSASDNAFACTIKKVLTSKLIPKFYDGTSTSGYFWYDSGVYHFKDTTHVQTFTYMQLYLGKRTEVENTYICFNYSSNRNIEAGINKSLSEAWGNTSKYRTLGSLVSGENMGLKFQITTDLLNQTNNGGAYANTDDVCLFIKIKGSDTSFAYDYDLSLRVALEENKTEPSPFIDLGNQGSSQWKGKTWAAYGDSITDISGGDDLNKGWAMYVNMTHEFSAFHGRGIGGQKYAWGTAGGAVSFIYDDGNLQGRNDNYNKDNYTGEVPEGTTACRSAFCSWDRITHMFPDSIKEDIDMVFVMGGTNDSNDGTDATWVANDTTDPEWANSDYYSTYGGDYNISTMKGGIASTIMKLQAWLPQALIVVGTHLSGKGTTGSLEMNPDTSEYNKSEDIRKTAKLFSCPCIDVWATSDINGMNRTTYITDGVHPYSDAGKMMLGRTITGGLYSIQPKYSIN